MSTYIFVAVGGGSIGLLLGGALTQTVDWHWIFFINLPIGLLAILLGRALIRDNARHRPQPRRGRARLGPGHAGVDARHLCHRGVARQRLGVDPNRRVRGRLDRAAGGVRHPSGADENPILPLRILRLRGLASSSAVRGIAATGLFGSFFFSALYLNRVLGFGPLPTGLAFLPQTLAVGALSLGITARLVQRFGAKTCTSIGLLAMLLALALLAGADAQTGYFPRLFVAYALMGVGGAMSFMPLLTIALAEVPMADAGIASGIVNVSMQLSAALGLAILGSVSTDHASTLVAQGMAPGSAMIGGYQFAFDITAVCLGHRPGGGAGAPARHPADPWSRQRRSRCHSTVPTTGGRARSPDLRGAAAS